MKKILEVLQDGSGLLRFNTDIDVTKNPQMALDITQQPYGAGTRFLFWR